MPKEIEVKSVLNKTKKRDTWFLDDYTVNLYQSCSFNCLYCYIRGSKYGNNLAKSLSVKINAIEILERQLAARAKKNQYGFIVLSSVTDPYLQIEEEYQMTRKALQVILKYKFPVHIITKSPMVARDFDLLQQIDEQAILPVDLQEQLGRGVILSFSFSTVDDGIGKIFEPGAPAPSLRLQAVRRSLEAGFHCGISLMPLLPWITDTTAHLELLYSTFQELKVSYLLPATITLFGSEKADSKTLMLKALAKHYPDLVAKYETYFANGSQMPRYYQNAFNKKMKEMLAHYALPNSILGG